MRYLFSILLLVLTATTASAGIIYADVKYGFDATDASDNYYNAIKGERNSNDTLVFRDMGIPWYITREYRMFDVDNLTIIFEPGCVIEAKDNYWMDNKKLLFILRATNLHIIGYGAKFVMHKDDFPNGEFGHAISIDKMEHGTIRGLELYGSGGDGLYLYDCKDVLIGDVYAHGHKRQGMTINKCDGLTIKDSRFEDTAGSKPMDGIDIEPDVETDTIKNVLIDNCVFRNNGGSGVKGAMGLLGVNSDTVSVKVKNSYFRKNNQLPAYVTNEITSGGTRIPYTPGFRGGYFIFENCVVDSSPSRTVYSKKKSNNFLLKYKNVVMYDTPSSEPGGPIFLEEDYQQGGSYTGGMDFDNVLAVYDNNYQVIRYEGWKTTLGLKDISGKITVLNPHPISKSIIYTGSYKGTTNENVTLSINRFSTLPTTTVNIYPDKLKAIRGGQKGSFLVTRSSSKIDYPVFVKYSVTASKIKMRDEVTLLTGAVVIPAGKTSALIDVMARAQETNMPDKELQLKIEARPDIYTIGNDNKATVVVSDDAENSTYIPQ